MKQKDSVPGWPLIAFTILLATSVGIVGCTSSSRMDSSEAGQDEALIDDNIINLTVNKRLIDDGLGLFKDVKAVVYRQCVLLIGTVEQADARDRASALVAEVENVVQVMNEIQVAVEGGIGAFITDVIIEKSIQSDYLFDDIIYMIGHAARFRQLPSPFGQRHGLHDWSCGQPRRIRPRAGAGECHQRCETGGELRSARPKVSGANPRNARAKICIIQRYPSADTRLC